jgi:hypothetical protein
MKKWYAILGVFAVVVLLAGVLVTSAFARGPNNGLQGGCVADGAGAGRGSGAASAGRGRAWQENEQQEGTEQGGRSAQAPDQAPGYGRSGDQDPVAERAQTWVDDAASEELSEAEGEGLLYMREEEKLARDVYLTLYQEWGLPIFENIAESEATHMTAVKTLIDRYGLEDPVADNAVGVFVDQKLQTLYDELVAQGNASLSSALRVGAAIEEIDILDLAAHIAETDKADLQQVYANLTRGSENHLRSFVSTLEGQTGESYQPQYLDPEAYDDIVTAQVRRGRGRGRGS